jgi:hypothetical protein
MKTIKIFLSIAGFALSTICFGQLISEDNNEVLFYTAYYNLASNRIEHQVTSLPEWHSSGDHFEAPVLSRTVFVPIEFDIAVEEWMTKPFESTYCEEDMKIESWMLSPFDSNYYEEELTVEAWMTAPF